MARTNEEDMCEIYTIPDNFIKEGYIGNVRTRNLVEAILLTVSTGVCLWNLPIEDLVIRLTVTLTFSTPLLLLGIVGINGDPISVFLKNGMHWMQSKRVMLFNGKAATRSTRPVETVLNQELPRDKIIAALTTVKQMHNKQRSNVLVEGRDFVFYDDDDFRRESDSEKTSEQRVSAKEAKLAKKAAAREKKEAAAALKLQKKEQAKQQRAAKRKKRKAKDATVTEEEKTVQAIPETVVSGISSVTDPGCNDDTQPTTEHGVQEVPTAVLLEEPACEDDLLEGELLDGESEETGGGKE